MVKKFYVKKLGAVRSNNVNNKIIYYNNKFNLNITWKQSLLFKY